MKRWDFPWTLAIAVTAIIATSASFASPTFRDLFVADARIFDGHWWRLLTGPFLHATWGHLVRDLALVAIAGIAYEAPLASRKLHLFFGGLLIPALAVLLAGNVQWYCGLSGLSHAMLAAALAYEFVQRRSTARVVVLAICAVALVKPLYELASGKPAFAMNLGDTVTQVPLAHVVGVFIGIACGLAAGVESRSAKSLVHRA